MAPKQSNKERNGAFNHEVLDRLPLKGPDTVKFKIFDCLAILYRLSYTNDDIIEESQINHKFLKQIFQQYGNEYNEYATEMETVPPKLENDDKKDHVKDNNDNVDDIRIINDVAENAIISITRELCEAHKKSVSDALQKMEMMANDDKRKLKRKDMETLDLLRQQMRSEVEAFFQRVPTGGMKPTSTARASNSSTITIGSTTKHKKHKESRSKNKKRRIEDRTNADGNYQNIVDYSFVDLKKSKIDRYEPYQSYLNK
ncbi:hypothetical protein TPHA_0H01150 [Tetrapisispora phaffii CBS 4417]|uniref:Uncharacterized protein n=1 Tax=Tetrapisispora phaffii (strain ATCC 24235 / CBS 4417 / NBRC 1672 / NRRL Y-8282 / UCD 70-5) TaxID=1071381 RepID=G8BX19_TETPH|nr:hypothetical protein TPHA_0H01150 [Tetrapisispora phaffii CBS 4417]CCE64323.1 hypothetical protein TPHA_0H01150 [Tetrapisispora phaffii CBS 4417]